jgi:hypothetical protein
MKKFNLLIRVILKNNEKKKERGEEAKAKEKLFSVYLFVH